MAYYFAGQKGKTPMDFMPQWNPKPPDKATLRRKIQSLPGAKVDLPRWAK